MGYYLTHLELSMIAILLIGLFGCQFEPGPVPNAMVVCGAIYIILHETVRRLYRMWRKRQQKPEAKVRRRRCYIYNLKEDEAWKEQKTNIS